MNTTTSTPMLWTEMTDELSEAVNGGGCHQSYYHCEKPKKKCETHYEEPTYYCEKKEYDHCYSKPKCW